MPRFRQTTEILKLMKKKENIRNIGIIAHIDHGKTTMTDSLLAEAGLLSPRIAGQARALDYLEEEQKRGITIKTANISLLHDMNGESYVINLVDTPGHVDFTGKVTRALRAIDGAVVVVDAVEEIMAQTEIVTRQALEERVKPALFINKVDRLIKELKLNSDEIQSKFARIIGDFNNIIEIYGEPVFKKKWKVNPEAGSVAFGSALHRWGFTLDKTKQERIRFAEIVEAYEKNKHQTLSRRLPLSKAILDMSVKNLPNPVEAQKYRIPKIWKGRLESEIGQTMLNCVDDGPTVMCITMAQFDPQMGVIATGRLFSGTVKEGDSVYLVGVGKEYRLHQVLMCVGAFRDAVDRIAAGNIAVLSGLDLARAGETLVTAKYKESMIPLEPVRYISEAVMTIAVEPRNPKDLPRLVEAIKRLSIEDPNLTSTIDEESGQYLLSGMGELHLEIALKFLRQYAEGVELAASSPVVAYREGIQKIGEAVTAKSLNRQNMFCVQVEPLESRLLDLIEKEEFTEERRRKYLKENAENVWSVDKYGNMLVNSTKRVQNLSSVKDSIISGFNWACRAGPLCGEPLRGIKAKLIAAELQEDAKMRETTQIARAVSRAILGSILTAKPALLEPIYNIEISVPVQWLGACSNILTRRRGKIRFAEHKGGLSIIMGHIPVAETFGLTDELRSATSGRAFWQCTFDRWDRVPEEVASEIISQIRARRGLPLKIPKPDKFIESAE